jgi:hypothetical protein
MRLPAPLLAALLAAAPLAAGEHAPGAEPRAEIEEGLSLLQRGAEALLRGLRQEMEPALDRMAEELAGLAARLDPILRDLAALIDDVTAYEAPVILPNGDILIRRRPDAPAYAPPAGGGPIDL